MVAACGNAGWVLLLSDAEIDITDVVGKQNGNGIVNGVISFLEMRLHDGGNEILYPLGKVKRRTQGAGYFSYDALTPS